MHEVFAAHCRLLMLPRKSFSRCWPRFLHRPQQMRETWSAWFGLDWRHIRVVGDNALLTREQRSIRFLALILPAIFNISKVSPHDDTGLLRPTERSWLRHEQVGILVMTRDYDICTNSLNRQFVTVSILDNSVPIYRIRLKIYMYSGIAIFRALNKSYGVLLYFS